MVDVALSSDNDDGTPSWDIANMPLDNDSPAYHDPGLMNDLPETERPAECKKSPMFAPGS